MDELLEGALMAGLGLLAIRFFADGAPALGDILSSLTDSFDNLLNNTTNDGGDMYQSTQYQSLFANAGAATGVPGALLSSVAFYESSYNPRAVSGVGAQGLMQLMPQYYPGIDPTDPVQAVPAAARSLRSYYDQFGSWRLALAAYNWGPGNVAKVGGDWSKIPSDVKTYANNILTRAGGTLV